ncbi:MAG: hypothetical protein EZS28_026584 [Streblomastix strix]|uniref:RRM domain-containing protein n=1 Tax=Streblomastix strix TaxID=222440 RepID=A0A5J4V513_9EUKA|nr:MAG: hypothetical protein EZS28_026584 [Streblomastix strix]
MNSPQSALKSSESDKNQKETNIQNNPSNKAIELIVRNLNYDTSEDKLRHLFTSIGQVNAVSIPVTFGRGRGYGFVTMEDEESANKCIQQLDGTEVDSRNNKAEIEVDDFIIPDLDLLLRLKKY